MRRAPEGSRCYAQPKFNLRTRVSRSLAGATLARKWSLGNEIFTRQALGMGSGERAPSASHKI